ncbi:hypothetical protein DL770_009940 [Monosporascus sp. CRB-9-2]|nr:hypothetical protein DL770_009940 [Monosporascus sp. CRB-9-2]
MAASVMAVSKSALDVISRDSLDEQGFVMQTPKAIHPSLSPGPKLDALNKKAVQILTESLERFASTDEPSVVKMNEWIRYEVMMATTEGIFGPRNPYRDPKIRSYEAGFVPLMMSVLPALMARGSVRAREALVKAYEKYYAERGYNDSEASSFIKDRYEFFTQRGIEPTDIAKMEVTTSIALIGNTMPATFWLVFHILSDAAVFNDCRKELSGAVYDRNGVCTVDVGYIKNSCPILLSTFQEVMRFHGIGVSARVVVEDSMLNGQFLLKKGGIVLIPAAAQHNLSSVWGENVGEFDHKRFLQEPGSKKRRYDPVAFRGFGGGSTLCPGRHFASTEILAFASFIILRFDVRPVSGNWVVPTTAKSNPGASMQQPDYDLDIEIRAHNNRQKWAISLSGSDKPMMVSAEDITTSNTK